MNKNCIANNSKLLVFQFLSDLAKFKFLLLDDLCK